MALIKGKYTAGVACCVGGVRYLDVESGVTYVDGDRRRITAGHNFRPRLDGTYANAQYVFTPDQPVAYPPTCDWYVLRHIPEGVFCGDKRPASTQCDGPYVEALARTRAIGWVKGHGGPTCVVSVVQIKQGDTYSKVTPATPEPTYSWS